jgi:hypothetical protein
VCGSNFAEAQVPVKHFFIFFEHFSTTSHFFIKCLKYSYLHIFNPLILQPKDTLMRHPMIVHSHFNKTLKIANKSRSVDAGFAVCSPATRNFYHILIEWLRLKATRSYASWLALR